MLILLALWAIANLLFLLRYYHPIKRAILLSNQTAPPLRYQIRRWYRRHRAQLGGIAFVLFLLLCYLLLSFVYA